MLPFFDPVDPSSARARQLLEHELSRGRYAQQDSLTDRIAQWLADLWDRYLGTSLGGGAPTVLLVVVVVLVVALLVWILPKVRRERRRPDVGPVLEESGTSPADYRARASGALQSGRLDDALLDTFRAIAAEAVDRTLLPAAPGQTAHEIGTGLGTFFPGQRDRLLRAADRFDAVRYGGRHAGRAQVDELVDLDRVLARARPVLSTPPAQPTAWTGP